MRQARRSSTAGSGGGRSSTRAGTPVQAWSARPNGPRTTPRKSTRRRRFLLNVDSAVSGHEDRSRWCPSLRDWVLDAAAAVTDVPLGKSPSISYGVCQSKRDHAGASQDPVDLPDLFSNGNGTSPDSARGPACRAGFFPQMQPLGSGSDYTVFLDHLGVPAVDVGFSGRYGVYHSVLGDNFTWMEKVGDPEFITHAHGQGDSTPVLAMRWPRRPRSCHSSSSPMARRRRDYTRDDLRRRIEPQGAPADPLGPSPKRRIECNNFSWKADRAWSRRSAASRTRRPLSTTAHRRPGPQGRRPARRSSPRSTHRPDPDRTDLFAARWPPGPPLVCARNLRPRTHDRLRLVASARPPPGTRGQGRPALRRCCGCPHGPHFRRHLRAPRRHRGGALDQVRPMPPLLKL